MLSLHLKLEVVYSKTNSDSEVKTNIDNLIALAKNIY